jgi:biopolymer transport protein ExbD
MNSSDNLLGAHRTRNPEDNLIPLINIVFLLLVFFMVAGQIGNQGAVHIDSPASASKTPLATDALEFNLDAQGVLTHQDQPISDEALRELLANSAGTEHSAMVVLRADRNATAESLERVFQQLRAEGIASLTLRTRLQEQP